MRTRVLNRLSELATLALGLYPVQHSSRLGMLLFSRLVSKTTVHPPDFSRLSQLGTNAALAGSPLWVHKRTFCSMFCLLESNSYF